MAGFIAQRKQHALRGLRSEFETIFRQRQRAMNARLGTIMRVVQSDGAYEVYGVTGAVPKVNRWRRGTNRTQQGISEFLQFVENYTYELMVPWHEEDEEDDQTGTLVDRVREGAIRFAQLPDRAYIEIITQTASDVLPTIQNAFDGFPLYSNGGGTRFSVTGGNIITGSGVALPSEVLFDLNAGIERFITFKDTEGEPRWVAEDLVNPLVICSPALREVMLKALRGNLLENTVGSTAPSTNVFANTFQLWVNNRLTGNDWFINLTQTETKPVIMQVRRPLRVVQEDFSNSETTRRTKQKQLMWDARLSWAPFDPMTTIQVDN